MQYQIPQPHAPIGGATNQQTYIFPPNQPDQAAYALLNQARYIVEAVKRFDGATRQQTFPVPPTSQPLNYSYDVNRYADPNPRRFEGATNQQTFPVPVVYQPLNYGYDINRYLDQVVKRFEGATKQQTYLFPPNQPEFRYYLPDINRYPQEGPQPQIHQGATKQQQYIFLPSQPVFSRYPLAQQPPVTLPILGTTVIAAQTYLFPLSQPQFAYYRPDVNTYMWEGPEQMFDGATKQQTFPVPPVSQPLNYGQRANYYSDVFRPIEGATQQQQYIFPVSQPLLSYYLRNTPAFTFLPINGVEATPQYSSNQQVILDGPSPFLPVIQIGTVSIPTWNTIGRPSSPLTGTIGYNTQTTSFEFYNGSAWKTVTLT